MDNQHQDLLKKISEMYASFSKGQKLIADYINRQYGKAAYMTAAKLGETVGVSESTVVRFADELGYEGYPKFQKALQELIKSKLTSVQRIEVSKSRINEDDVLKSVLQSDMEKLKITLDEIDKDQFNKIVEIILNARRIYILGVRSSAPLAGFLGFYFNLLFDDIRIVNTTSESEVFEQIVHAGKGDLLIGISFPRYSRRTLKSMEFAKSQGATAIAITDSKESPLAKAADYSLFARSDMASFADSLVAPLSVINALIVALGLRKKESIYEVFNKLENLWDEYQVYEKDDHK
ncbi:MAG: MurR/RpiR family transcriptional regulator [Eubacteriales bacterium]|nr:MurR/RpiR family transcriptional regulator [Eubacteriales bacterium]